MVGNNGLSRTYGKIFDNLKELAQQFIHLFTHFLFFSGSDQAALNSVRQSSFPQTGMPYLFLSIGHLNPEVGDAILWQRLPRIDVCQFGLHQIHVLNIAVCLHYFRRQLQQRKNSETLV